MLKKPLEFWESYEVNYPGFISSVVRYENAILPLCSLCGSWHTAKVGCGIVSRSIHLAGATTRFRLDPSNPGKFYCNVCGGYFTPEEWTDPIWWHELIRLD